MKKADFLDALRQLSKGASKETLTTMLFVVARQVPANDYGMAIKDCARAGAQVYTEAVPEGADLKAAEAFVKKARDGGFCLEWDYERSEYDEEALLDQDGLGERAGYFLKSAAANNSRKQYKEALGIFDALFDLEAFDHDNYVDEGVTLQMLFDQDLVTFDFNDALLQYAYAALMVLRDEKRVEKFETIAFQFREDFQLRRIFSAGEDEIPECGRFLDQWIARLTQRYSPDIAFFMQDRVMRCLIDALKYKGGVEALSSFAAEHGADYPQVYVDLIAIYIDQRHFMEARASALDALATLDAAQNPDTPGSYARKCRITITEQLRTIGEYIQDSDAIRTGIWEGFRAALDLRHFLPLYQIKDKDLLFQAIQLLPSDGKMSVDLGCVRFLNGDIEQVWAQCAEDKASLGWSAGFKGSLFPLFVALLMKDHIIRPCAKKLIVDSLCADPDNTFAVFAAYIGELRLPDSGYDRYWAWCEKEAADRVEAIVRGQHRRSYGKASLLVTAMAEAVASRDGMAAALEYINSFRLKYPRHTTFHACLRKDITRGEFSAK
ncbi:MAG: hypothetical protein LBS62_06040 [Clostridiales bacterium]|nr:hypothetical protein [Clostridiales bacterium]